jgi:ubiquinone biosynthesis monooxygenase Coq7
MQRNLKLKHFSVAATQQRTQSHGLPVGQGSLGKLACFNLKRARMDTLLNTAITAADNALRTLFAKPHASRPCPTLPAEPTELDADEKAKAGALMRVNHVGEVCAQALYAAQALSTRDPVLRQQFIDASREEGDHLAWTHERLAELGARPSLLNPLWYAGAFGLGLVAGRLGDRLSLGFVMETERQVESHLASHLEQLPAGDHASRAIVAQMKDDEARHARDAAHAGAQALPMPVKALMRASAKVMTTTARYI